MKTEFLQSAKKFADEYSSIKLRLDQANSELVELRKLSQKIANKESKENPEDLVRECLNLIEF